MAVFWITFRIHDNASYSERYLALQQAVNKNTHRTFWDEPTSFILFESESAIGTIAKDVAAAIDAELDVALIRAADSKNARIVGTPHDEDVFKLMDYLQNA